MTTWIVNVSSDDRSRSHEIRLEAATAVEALELAAQRIGAARAGEPLIGPDDHAPEETSTPAQAGQGTSL